MNYIKFAGNLHEQRSRLPQLHEEGMQTIQRSRRM